MLTKIEEYVLKNKNWLLTKFHKRRDEERRPFIIAQLLDGGSISEDDYFMITGVNLSGFRPFGRYDFEENSDTCERRLYPCILADLKELIRIEQQKSSFQRFVEILIKRIKSLWV